MLQLTPQSIIFVATAHVDFRRGIDGLAAICRNVMLVDPLSGTLFLFYNRCKTSFKILTFDGQGYWLIQKRLSKGSFKHIHHKFSTSKIKKKHQSYKSDGSNSKGGNNLSIVPDTSTLHYRQICHKILGVLINNGDPTSAQFPKDWRSI